MGFGIKAEFWGDYALFSRPEMKVERVSYDVPTPSAARGMLEAVMWHPGMRWKIDRIYVLNSIATTNIRRNEVKSKILASNVMSAMNGTEGPLYINTSADIQQRASLILTDVHYVVEAHFDMTDKASESDTPEKFYAMACRRLRRGQCFHQPYFGTREFPAKFGLYEREEHIATFWDKLETEEEQQAKERMDLGYMLYDMDYTDPQNIQPMFFHAVLQRGVLDVTDCEVHR